MSKTKVILIMIILIGAILRLYNLGVSPTGLNADEAAIGYNAYSLLQTGKDEYGQSFPLAFKSFGDYKPGLYFYFVMPFVATLGLNEWAVRLPSALFGIATIYIVYLLGKILFKKDIVGISCAFVLAIAPWHIHFSRGGWESNTANFFIALGVYLFLRGLTNTRYMLFSWVSFVLSMYLYQSPRLIVPILVLGLMSSNLKFIKKNIKRLLIYVALILVISVPLILQFTSGGGSARFSGLSFISDMGPVNRTNELRGSHQDPNSLDTKLLHNKVTYLIPTFLDHYLDHFSSQFLFIRGEEVIRNKVPEVGQFYMIFSVLMVIGIVGMILKKEQGFKVVFLWLLISPLASAMTFQTPSALRSVMMVVPYCLIIGYGLSILISLKKSYLKTVIVSLLFIAISFELVHYLESYHVHYPKRTPIAWEYGFSEMVSKLSKHQNDYSKVVITDRYDQPYILVLFYLKYDPANYQTQAFLTERDKFNFGTVRSFDKYEFKRVTAEDLKEGNLLIGTKEEIPPGASIVDRVVFPNGEDAFVFAKL